MDIETIVSDLKAIRIPLKSAKSLEEIIFRHDGLEHTLVVQLDESFVDVEEVKEILFLINHRVGIELSALVVFPLEEFRLAFIKQLPKLG